MFIKIVYLSIFFILTRVIDIHAQSLKVASFETKTNDSTARIIPRKDINGIECALIKVKNLKPGVSFDNKMVVGDVEYRDGDYLVYVPNGSKRLKVARPNCLPLEIVYEDYGIKTVQSKTTYYLTFVNRLKVRSIFEDKMSLSARMYPRVDMNGKECALLKVRIVSQGLIFGEDIVGAVDQKGNEYWVYVPEGCESLKIFHPFYLPSEFVFRDYGIDTIKSKAVYILTFDETLKVNSMTESPNDLSAMTYSRKDMNDVNSALIKVQNLGRGVSFDGWVLGDVKYKDGEYWVYVPDGAISIRVRHPDYLLTKVNFKDFGIESVHSQSVYNLIFAEELKVGSMNESLRDLSASTSPRLDDKGVECALIKVQIVAQNVTFAGSIVGEVEYKDSEYWVYMKKGSKRLMINHPNCMPLEVLFEDYGIEEIKGKTTYTLSVVKNS